MRSLTQGCEAQPRDDAVLADERNDVGERADGGNLHERGEVFPLAGAVAQSLDQLQGDADPGEVLVRISAVVPLGLITASAGGNDPSGS